MLQSVPVLLAVVCACLTYDVSAQKSRQEFPNDRSLQDRRPGQNLGFVGQTGTYPSFIGTQGRADDRGENKGRGNGFPWLPKARKSMTATNYARPDDLGEGGRARQAGRTAGQARYRRDYGYFPGGGFYGPRFGGPGLGYGSGGDYGQDFGYGSDNWRRE